MDAVRVRDLPQLIVREPHDHNAYLLRDSGFLRIAAMTPSRANLS